MIHIESTGQSGMGTYAGAARRRVHLATVLLRLPSGHRPGTPCPHPSDRTPPYATTKHVGASSAWTSHSDLDKKNPMGNQAKSRHR